MGNANDVENLLAAITPGGIENQEARGQRTLCGGSMLPKDCAREELEALGVKFGAEADDLFVNVELPPGWSVKATNHRLWSDFTDASGKRIASIFYKAAFYDRHAKLHMARPEEGNE